MKFKSLVITFFYLALSLLSAAQIEFKDGYIVNNRHERIDCLIRNVGNEESAMNYEYRLEDSKTIEKIELSKIEEFGIDNELKCIRAFISIDASPNRISSIKDTIIQWEEGHAFINVLVEGQLASLYSYYDHGRPLFFFSWGDSNIEPLLYKKYYVEVTPTIIQQTLYNNTYRDQLRKYLACENLKDADKIDYSKKDLVRYFANYHKCKNADFQQFQSSQIKKGILLFKPGISLNRIQLGVQDPIDAALKVFFVEENSIGFGAEAEFILPFNKYKWSIFAEGNYLSYGTDEISVGDELSPTLYDEYDIDYKSLEIPVGIAHYMHLNKNQRFFIRGAYVPHFILSDSYITFNAGHKYQFSPSSRLLIGAGYNYRDLAVEFRYYSPQNITQNIYKRNSDLTQVSLKISYALQLAGEKGVR